LAPEKVPCGKFLKPFGVAGELKFQPYFPEQLDTATIASGIIRRPSGKAVPDEEILISSARPLSGGIWALRPDGCESPEFARKYTNAELFVDRSKIGPPPEGEYLPFDIIDNTVYDTEGNKLGVVRDLYETGANDVWEVVADDGREILIPVIDEVVISVEPDKIVVKLPDGLLD
jgi:16S rRNA processing protein RimM